MFSKKPRQFLLIRQSYLGVLVGYMSVYRGNAFTPINLPNFPITEKTRTSEQILRYASLVLGPTLSQRRAASNSRTGELEGSVIANGGVVAGHRLTCGAASITHLQWTNGIQPPAIFL
jgi:hypothetical protein